MFGEGGGNEAGPHPVSGVIPVPGVRPVRTKLDVSNASACWTRAELAGVGRLPLPLCSLPSSSSSSPERSDEIAGVLSGQVKSSRSSSGVVMWPIGGSDGLTSPGVVRPLPPSWRLASVVANSGLLTADGCENESSNGLTSPVSLARAEKALDGKIGRSAPGSLDAGRDEAAEGGWADGARAVEREGGQVGESAEAEGGAGDGSVASAGAADGGGAPASADLGEAAGEGVGTGPPVEAAAGEPSATGVSVAAAAAAAGEAAADAAVANKMDG